MLLGLLSIAALLYAAACAWLYSSQRSMLYYPTPETAAPGAERIELTSEGETLRIWRAGPPDARQAVIYFGGNAEDVAQDVPLYRNIFANAAVYLANYRGYGGSTGSPSEHALFADALALYDYVHARHPDVSVIGRSLGSGVAAYLASMREVRKLVLVTPYDSIENVAKKQFPAFPVSLLLRDKFASNTRVAAIKARVLIVVAENDDVVPRANTNALIALLPAAKVVMIPGTSHHTISSPELYAETLRGFF